MQNKIPGKTNFGNIIKITNSGIKIITFDTNRKQVLEPLREQARSVKTVKVH